MLSQLRVSPLLKKAEASGKGKPCGPWGASPWPQRPGWPRALSAPDTAGSALCILGQAGGQRDVTGPWLPYGGPSPALTRCPSLQGLLVLLFHCVLNREVRKHLKAVLAGKKLHPDDSATTRATLLTVGGAWGLGCTTRWGHGCPHQGASQSQTQRLV